MLFATFCDALAYLEIDAVDGAHTDAGQLSRFSGCQVQCKAPENLPELRFRDPGMLVIAILGGACVCFLAANHMIFKEIFSMG